MHVPVDPVYNMLKTYALGRRTMLMLKMLGRRTGTVGSTFTRAHKADSAYALDTNVASYILDGDLWSHSPIDLVPYLYPGLTTLQEDFTIANISETVAVRQSLACHHWARQAKAAGVPLLIMPTVVVELLWAKQVHCTLILCDYQN